MNTHPITDQTLDQPAVTRWRLDPTASRSEFQVPHFWGLVTVKGHFERLDGWLEIDESEQRQISLTIDAASLHTGSRKRDKHLRSAALFDTQNHPEVRFRSTSVSVTPERTGSVSRASSKLPASACRYGSTPRSTRRPAGHRGGDRRPALAWHDVEPTRHDRGPATLTVHARLRRES